MDDKGAWVSGVTGWAVLWYFQCEWLLLILLQTALHQDNTQTSPFNFLGGLRACTFGQVEAFLLSQSPEGATWKYLLVPGFLAPTGGTHCAYTILVHFPFLNNEHCLHQWPGEWSHLTEEA